MQAFGHNIITKLLHYLHAIFKTVPEFLDPVLKAKMKYFLKKKKKKYSLQVPMKFYFVMLFFSLSCVTSVKTGTAKYDKKVSEFQMAYRNCELSSHYRKRQERYNSAQQQSDENISIVVT